MISSRTPEGWPNTCPVCGHDLCIEPSTYPVRDAPCPDCGTLLDFEESVANTIQYLVDDSIGLLAQLDRWASSGDKSVLRVDIGDVEFLDSFVIGKFMMFHRKAMTAGSRLVLCNPSSMIREELQIMKLDRILGIEDDEDNEFSPS